MAMKKEIIDQAVDRFLCWKLPQDFYPDCYIEFDKAKASRNFPFMWPTGTNLFTSGQARAMFEHCLTATAQSSETEKAAQLCDAVKDNSRNHLFRSAATICAAEIRAQQPPAPQAAQPDRIAELEAQVKDLQTTINWLTKPEYPDSDDGVMKL